MTLYKCSNCDEVSAKYMWADVDIECGHCGNHYGVRCPCCKKVIDLVYDSVEEVNEGC